MKKLLKISLTLTLTIIIVLGFTLPANPPGWFQQTIALGNTTITDIHFLDPLNGWVITDWSPSFDTGYVFKTSDGGNNWSFQYRFHGSFTAIQMTNYNTGYITGSTGSGKVWKTTNGGINWNIQANFSANPTRDLYFANSDTGWVCSDDAISGGIFKTTNGGANWLTQTTHRGRRLFFINKDTGWTPAESNTLFRTTNGGTNWDLQFTFSPGAPDIFFVGKDTGWAIAGPTGIMKTTNGGFNWFSQTSPSVVTGTAKIFFITNKRGYIGGTPNRIIATIDGGDNWGNQTLAGSSNYTIFFTDTLNGWAGTSVLNHTTDGGGPFTGVQQISNEIPQDYKLYQNYPNPFNPETNIKYTVKRETENVKLVVYDIQGKRITELVNQKQSVGIYKADWNASGYPSGVYFYSLIIEGRVNDTKKMMLVK